jgi:hypothetical protein
MLRNSPIGYEPLQTQAAGYLGDDYDDSNLEFGACEGGNGEIEDVWVQEGPSFAGEDGEEEEIGRWNRYRRGRLIRTSPRLRRRRRAARQQLRRQEAPMQPQQRFIEVDDKLFVIVATDTSAGEVSAYKAAEEDMFLGSVVFDGSSNGATLHSIAVGKLTIEGPHDGEEAVEASMFTTAKEQKLTLGKAKVRAQEKVYIRGTIATGGDKLKATFFTKQVVPEPARGCR